MIMEPKIHTSTSYMWSSKDRLGSGATGEVYLGYHKRSGTKVAVKMFTKQQEFKAMRNEMETIKQLRQHENIVQFLDINEQEKERGTPLIIMELCNGGSLYEIIDSPENAYGLEEEEFKKVMSDVATGLSHLKKYGFAHRDIKPGNIMKCLNPDGTYVFKLADFGTARKLDADQKFTSLHGTEEYLYPALYERALINPRADSEFDHTIDLWSVGATFFHLATGRLPFQPFRRRNDRKMMYEIISKKKTGTILGWQMEEGGQIFYNNELPPDVRLSRGLRDAITPTLSGLLENNQDRMIEFDVFFRHVDMIVKMKVVDVFCVSKCTCHKVYMDPGQADGISILKQQLSRQVSIDSRNMEVYFESIPCKKMSVRQLPATTVYNPFTVFGGPPLRTDELEIPALPKAGNMPPEGSLTEDIRFAKDSTKVVWSFRHSAELMHRTCGLMHQSARCLGQTVQQQFSAVKEKVSRNKEAYNSIIKILQCHIGELHSEKALLNAISQTSRGVFDGEVRSIEDDLRSKQRQHQDLCDMLNKLVHHLEHFEPQVQSLLELHNWDSAYRLEDVNKHFESIKFFVKTIEDLFKSFQQLKKDRGLNPGLVLSQPFDKKVHEYNKIIIKERVVEAQRKVTAMIEFRAEIYRKLFDFLKKCILLREDLYGFTASLDSDWQNLQGDLMSIEKWYSHHQQRIQRLQQKMPSLSSSSLPSQQPPQHGGNQRLLSDIGSILQQLSNQTQENLSLVNEQKSKLQSNK